MAQRETHLEPVWLDSDDEGSLHDAIYEEFSENVVGNTVISVVSVEPARLGYFSVISLVINSMVGTLKCCVHRSMFT